MKDYTGKLIIGTLANEEYIIAIRTGLDQKSNLEILVNDLKDLGKIENLKQEGACSKVKEENEVCSFITKIKPIGKSRDLFDKLMKNTYDLICKKKDSGEYYKIEAIEDTVKEGDAAKYRLIFKLQNGKINNFSRLLSQSILLLESANETGLSKIIPGSIYLTNPMAGDDTYLRQVNLDMQNIYLLLGNKLNVTAEEIQSSRGSDNLRAARAVISRFLIEKHGLPEEKIAEILKKSKQTISKLSSRFLETTLGPLDLQNLKTYVEKVLKAYNGPID
jgi:hypothetical protein